MSSRPLNGIVQTYARIENGVVVETIETDQDIGELFLPGLNWVACDPVVEQNWRYDGAAFAPPPAVDIRVYRAAAAASVSAMAEAARLYFITPGSGKALSYQEKAAEARDCLANHDAANPPAGKYLLLESEVGATLADVLGVAAVVDGRYRFCKAMDAQINGTEIGTKRDIDAAATREDIKAIVAGLARPTPLAEGQRLRAIPQTFNIFELRPRRIWARTSPPICRGSNLPCASF